MFVKNVWYVAGTAAEINTKALLARTVAGVPLVLYRSQAGSVIAMFDRCPHRFAPLSRGKLLNDVVECGYHGISFDTEGRCVRNPCGPIVQSLHVATYPIVQKHGMVWVWLGEVSEADSSSIPDLWFASAQEKSAMFNGYIPVKANHLLLVDNILDLSHADFLHLDTLANATSGRPKIAEEANTVVSTWVNHAVPAMPIHRPYLPTPETLVDTTMTVRWYSGGAMHVESTASVVNNSEHPTLIAHAAHVFTPESNETTHYFYTVWRNWNQGDADYTEAFRQGLHRAFDEEDKPMIEAQQKRIGDRKFEDLHPALTAMDVGPTRARRIYGRLLSAERSPISDAHVSTDSPVLS